MNKKKVIGLLGVGFDAEDGHIRITNGDRMDVYMGSEESHENIVILINKIMDELERKGIELTDLSLEEFTDFVGTII